MKIATWNVNSVRARCERVYQWLKQQRPDILCLQETKCVDGAFPNREFELLGYKSVFYGQKSYNGVAILSPHPIEDVFYGFVNEDPSADPGEDEQARLIAATIQGVRVVSAYVPNGTRVGSANFDYKLDWMDRLRDAYLADHFDPGDDLILCGDFNVAPTDEDVWAPDLWSNSIICHDDVRSRFERILDFGFTETFRSLHPEQQGAYTWWDYTRGSVQQNKGVRIDFILATDSMQARLEETWIDLEERKQKKPSDHAPLVATFTT